MSNRQQQILLEVAERHGLSKKQAEEIWSLFTEKIRTTISEPNKRGKDGLYEIDNFPIIHIDNFGKFVPNLRNIRHANKCLENKKKND